MSLVTGSLPNLVNGVSQQPASIRLSSQCELQVNGLSSVAEGLRKRPPASHVAKIGTGPVSNRFVHIINRDTVERYVVVVGGGDLKVYDLAGVEKTVNFPAGKGYLTHTGAAQSAFRAVTIADSTFLINTERTVLKNSAVNGTLKREAIVDVRQGNYGKTYRILINGGTAATYTTPDGGQASHSAQIDTTFIATQLHNALVANVTNNTTYGWQFARYGATIHITSGNNVDFDITVEDGFNGYAMRAAKGQVQKFSDLPVNAPPNFTIEVVGTDGSDADNYYVKFVTSTTGGLWKETLKPGIQYRIDSATMPCLLVREANGSFTFQQIAWGDRLVGDDSTAPFPSFVGNKITDMFFYRNRLGFLSNENVIFSEAGKFYSFFPKTVTTVLDTDPIDVGVSHTKVSLLRHAVPFAENLILFSGQTQFKVNAGDKLTPATISIDQTTEFECSTDVKPVGVGQTVYFAVPRGSFSGVKEYFVESDNQTMDASDVTAHVPNYIPGDLFKMAAATNEDILVALSKAQASRVYVYKFYWAGEEKLQSAWSYWEFAAGDTIVNCEFIESDLYLLVSRADGLYIERIRVSPGVVDTDSPFLVHLDRKHTRVGGTYNAATNRTTFSTPFDYSGGGWAASVASGQSKPAGQVLDVTRDSSTTASVIGNFAGVSLLVGRRYTFRYRFSTVMIRQDTGGGGQKSVDHGRLQLLRIGLGYTNTGYFKTHVYVTGNDTPYTTVFTGKILGSANTRVGEPSLETGVFYTPVKTRNTNAAFEVTSDSPYPCNLLNAQWEGHFNTRARSV
jgi:hypothetical protein